MLVRVVANAVKLGGGERSMRTVVAMLQHRGHWVIWHPTLAEPFAFDPGCERGAPFYLAGKLESDLLYYVVNNSAPLAADPKRRYPAPDPAQWGLAQAARRRVMMLNFWGCDGAPVLAPLFDRFAFLSTGLQRKWIAATGTRPGHTWVHAPAVELEKLLQCRPNYEAMIVARHSAQNKWPPITTAMTRLWRYKWRFMGAPRRILARLPEPVRSAALPAGAQPVEQFLDGASCFVYPLPATVVEQGPRVVVEAMAAGLPCLVDDRDGPAERVVPGTGWRMARHTEYLTTLRRLNARCLRQYGKAARLHAQTAFNPWHWADWLEDVAT